MPLALKHPSYSPFLIKRWEHSKFDCCLPLSVGTIKDRALRSIWKGKLHSFSLEIFINKLDHLKINLFNKKMIFIKIDPEHWKDKLTLIFRKVFFFFLSISIKNIEKTNLNYYLEEAFFFPFVFLFFFVLLFFFARKTLNLKQGSFRILSLSASTDIRSLPTTWIEIYLKNVFKYIYLRLHWCWSLHGWWYPVCN